MLPPSSEKIAIIGLGYVGLPLALAFSKHFPVMGVETESSRLEELQIGVDRTAEVDAKQLQDSTIGYTSNIADAKDCTVFIITVPTPVTKHFSPNISLLREATKSVGKVLKKGDMVIFESTVCPGTTDKICIPLLEEEAKLSVNQDFDCAYSPERIAPGEKGLAQAIKIVSATNDMGLQRVCQLYGLVITAGLHKAESIKVAEAAKISENIQRDVDIAITNELAMIFSQMGIDSHAVFESAATKWNYRRFYPGLVGGHCIGVDSYYLLDHAKQAGYTTQILQAARAVNNSVPLFIAKQVFNLLDKNKCSISESRILIMGYAFKENCPDVRNTLVEPLRQSLMTQVREVSVCDPIADATRAKQEHGVELIGSVENALAQQYDVIIFAVAHQVFKKITKKQLAQSLVVDIKGIAPRSDWRL